MQLLSPAQLVGYLSFALGVAAFLQRSDRRLKLLNGLQSLLYALHFALLGNPTAAVSASVSSARSFLALRFQRAWVAALILGVNLSLGAALARGPAAWLPVVGTCLTTVAMFGLRGVPMRLVCLGSTALWLTNAVLSRSVGGVLLESTVAVASLTTVARLLLWPPPAPEARPEG